MKTCVYQAKEAIREAERCDPDSIFTQFYVYKIAVQENNVEKGIYKTLVVLCIHSKSVCGSIVAILLQLHFQHILSLW